MPETILQEQERHTEDPSASGRKMTVSTGIMAVVSLGVSVFLLLSFLMGSGNGISAVRSESVNVSIMDKYDMFMTNEISNALDGVLSIKKVYWLSDDDLIAPEPDPACYGEASSPAELLWLLEEAAELIDGQEMLFSADTNIWRGDKIYYYYDETILVITWKEVRDGAMYTISEVKIADASQFRRLLADGQYGSDKQYTTTEMSASVNAVMASSGDFYKFRQYGTIVYNGVLQRFEGHSVDTCFIDEQGNLLFAYRDQFQTEEDAERFVQENNIRFSLAFGPVLVDNGEMIHTASYGLGEIKENYSRAALCQRDRLHYLVVNACGEAGYVAGQTISQFAKQIASLGCEKAYALDGGQTTVIAMDDKMISKVDFGTQRRISDIIYFATALP